MSDESTQSKSVGLTMTGTARAQVVRNLAMSPQADQLLADLARRSGHNEGNVLRLALGMFRTALDAKDEGKHIGITRDSDDLDIEFVGF